MFYPLLLSGYSSHHHLTSAETVDFKLEATPRIELGMEVLQTSALPLGYVATPFETRFYLRCPSAQAGAPLP